MWTIERRSLVYERAPGGRKQAWNAPTARSRYRIWKFVVLYVETQSKLFSRSWQRKHRDLEPACLDREQCKCVWEKQNLIFNIGFVEKRSNIQNSFQVSKNIMRGRYPRLNFSAYYAHYSLFDHLFNNSWENLFIRYSSCHGKQTERLLCHGL